MLEGGWDNGTGQMGLVGTPSPPLVAPPLVDPSGGPGQVLN